MRAPLHLVLGAAITLLAGCERTVTVANEDARDRDNPLIRRAMEREQIGDFDSAIKAYEAVLLETPKLVSAHFHLALLLQDYRKDYMGAIYHYRQYEQLRPDSEKKALLRDRTRICQQSLVAQLLSSGDVAISRKQLELVGEIDKLNKRLSQAEGEKSALKEQKDAVERLLAEQKSETERLRRLLDRMLPTSTGEEPRPRSVLPRLDPIGSAPPPSHISAPPPPILRPAAAEPIPEPPAATKPAATTASPEPPPLLLAPAPPAITAENDPASAHPASAPISAATRTYAVQPGDSVYRIAERVYGDPEQWKRIRDANKDRLGPSNQLRAGQILVIP
ncbi:MAG: LysM peptidoglycan-binding domain-containing protein [bacterium]